MADTHLCQGEGRRFPKTEFCRKNGKLVHNTDDPPPHYALTGEPVDDEDRSLPGPLDFDPRK